jgi:hypothetical protein
VPGNGEGRGHLNPGLTPTATATNGPPSIPDHGDPRAIGELVAAWLDVRMGEIDDLVAEARSRVEAIPDQRAVWLLVGELVMRLHVVEQEVAELRRRRERKRSR